MSRGHVLSPQAIARALEMSRAAGRGKGATRGLSVRAVKLVPRGELPVDQRPPLYGGRKSRRPRQNVWVPR
jgi:hypothetical protein